MADLIQELVHVVKAYEVALQASEADANARSDGSGERAIKLARFATKTAREARELAEEMRIVFTKSASEEELRTLIRGPTEEQLRKMKETSKHLYCNTTSSPPQSGTVSTKPQSDDTLTKNL